MTNSNLPDDPTWQAFGALQNRVQAIGREIRACKIDMERMGHGFPYRSFPEDGMINIAGQLANLSGEVLSMSDNAAKLRAEVAA